MTLNNDPFADVSTDVDDDVVPFAEPVKKAPVKKPAAKSGTDSEGKLTVTLKGGAGFDAPWIVIHSTDVDDALDVFGDPGKLANLMERVQSAGKFFAGLAPAKAAASSSGGAPARPGSEAPNGTEEAPGPDWTYKTGVGKNGKTWKAWMPPRGSDAQPVWLR